MSSRSFDHMLGGLKFAYPRINGLNGSESNPDTNGNLVKVQPNAQFQGQLTPDPGHSYPDVDFQIFGGAPPEPQRVANMQGFVKDYFSQTKDVNRSHNIMYYFTPDKLPVLTTLAAQFAVFNGWFSSIPGPIICNRAFAHYGTSFGHVGRDIFYVPDPGILSIYERMIQAGHTAKIYYYDEQSSTMEVVSLLKKNPEIFGRYNQFISDCDSGALPEYSFVEPCYNIHTGVDGGLILASDQHPDHDVREGERFIANTYNAIRTNPALWQSTALLIVYDQHGGIYDHVVPPACTPDGYTAPASATGTGTPFSFDRLGVRVPAVLVSPWIPRGTIVPGIEDPANARIFEHASIPATVTNFFLKGDAKRTVREEQASSFLDLLSDQMLPDPETPYFKIHGAPLEVRSGSIPRNAETSTPGPEETPTIKLSAEARSQLEREKTRIGPQIEVPQPTTDERAEQERPTEVSAGPSTHVARDRWTTNDSLGHFPYAYAIYRFLTDEKTQPPLAVSIQAPWGGGKTSLMRMIQAQLDPDATKKAEQVETRSSIEAKPATVKHVLQELKSVSPEGDKGDRDATTTSVGSKLPGQNEKARFRVPMIAGGGERRVTIWFNAWKYESTTQVWAGLADCIVQQIGERLGPVERELFWFRLQLRRLDAAKIRRKIYEEVFSQFLGKFLPWLWAYVLGPGVSVLIALIAHLRNSQKWEVLAWSGAVFLSCCDLLTAWKQVGDAKSEVQTNPAQLTLGELVEAPDYDASLGLVHQIAEDLKRVFETIPEKYLPMVVFIDDLDRCSPGKVAAVVEAVNLFLAGEFPDCMFVLGIDDEMVAAALDQAHADVIAKLPGYAKSTSIGWRFMDKFVQLPFIVPPSSAEELTRYVDSLFSKDSGPTDIDMEARDRAARVVEQTEGTPATAEEVVRLVADQKPMAAAQQEALKKDVEIIQEMNHNIKKFSDQEKTIRELIKSCTKNFFSNPRDLKRFVNLFRFYYFLRAAREARREPVTSLEQMCRWLVFSLKWPEVLRWLRRRPSAQGAPSNLSLKALEQIGAKCLDLTDWKKGADTELRLDVDQTPWLSDEGLLTFFQTEAALAERERLSACYEKGLW